MDDDSRRMRLADLFCQDPNSIAKAIEHWINLKPVWPDQQTHLLENFNWQWKLQDLFEALKLASVRSETARQVLKDAEGDPCLDFNAAISAAGGHIAEGQNFEAAAEHIGYFQQAMQHYVDGFLADFIKFLPDNYHAKALRAAEHRVIELGLTESQKAGHAAMVEALGAEFKARLFQYRTEWEQETGRNWPTSDAEIMELAVEIGIDPNHFIGGLWANGLRQNTPAELFAILKAGLKRKVPVEWHPEMISVSKLGELISRREFGSRYPQEKLSKTTVERRLAPEWKNNRIRRPAGKTKGPVQVRSDFWDELTAQK